MEQQGAVLYHEPSILTILTQSSFLLALVSVDFALDPLIYCGLIGQILVGLAYGTPGGDILGTLFQQTITDLGYLGLILIVYEGGLSTDMKALKSNALLSVLVALTGISLPIGISFVLIAICNASVLQGFAAGCALSSTSLGTTFTILKASGLDKNRLGVVLTSAAMLDDVVGLVLVQVISNLGSSGQGFTAITVARPIFVSFAYALVVPLALYGWKRLILPICVKKSSSRLVLHLRSGRGQLVLQTVLLISGVTSAAYAGTSTLLAAYLAGLLVVSCESLTANENQQQNPAANEEEVSKDKSLQTPAANGTMEDTGSWELVRDTSPGEVESNSNPVVGENPSEKIEDKKLKIPTERADQDINKSVEEDARPNSENRAVANPDVPSTIKSAQVFEAYYAQPLNRIFRPFFFASIGFSIPITRLFTARVLWRGIVYAILMVFGKACCGLWLIRFTSTRSKSSSIRTSSNHKIQQAWSRLSSYRPQSLYPACMLGSAMVARGEIGFLISAIAESNGIFDQEGGSDQLFLIVTWAILLCTIVGPLVVGLMARRVKRLERRNEESTVTDGIGKEHPLGIWKDI